MNLIQRQEAAMENARLYTHQEMLREAYRLWEKENSTIIERIRDHYYRVSLKSFSRGLLYGSLVSTALLVFLFFVDWLGKCA